MPENDRPALADALADNAATVAATAADVARGLAALPTWAHYAENLEAARAAGYDV